MYLIKNPYYEVLKKITGKEPPEFCKEIFNTRELNEDQYDILHQWCYDNSGLEWVTGIGHLEAVDYIVDEAVSNGNICDKSDVKRLNTP